MALCVNVWSFWEPYVSIASFKQCCGICIFAELFALTLWLARLWLSYFSISECVCHFEVVFVYCNDYVPVPKHLVMLCCNLYCLFVF